MAWTEEDLERMLGRGQVRLVSERTVPLPAPQPSHASLSNTALDIWQPQGVTLRLPISPSTNRYWRSIISGKGARLHAKVLVSREGRRYRIDAGVEVLKQWPQHEIRPLAGRLRITAAIFPENKRSFDIDNRIKSLLDFLQVAGVYANDSQIDDIHLLRCGSIGKPGCIVVQITQIDLKDQRNVDHGR